MPAEWKSAFEVPLLRERVSLHEPRAVGILRCEQECHAFAIHLVGSRDACYVQRIKRHACRIGIRRRTAKLGPATAGFLSITNPLDRGSDTIPRRIRPRETHQTHRAFLRGIVLRGTQPLLPSPPAP